MQHIAYYNEIDPYAAQWLRNLIAAGHIAPGFVDERDIRDVKPTDLVGYKQCHFFAGIGGWSFALRLAGWPDDRPVWTGSCPCQPFSAAGQRKGSEDERHLWPEWFCLIRECSPPVIFGEQVSNASLWLDGVCADLEDASFAVGAADLSAASVGAKHKRYRFWFVAHPVSEQLRNESGRRGRSSGQGPTLVTDHGAQRALAGAALLTERKPSEEDHSFAGGGQARPQLSGLRELVAHTNSKSPIGATIARPECDPWSTEPAVGRVVDGLSHKLVEPALRGFGNAIVPQVAAEFISAYLDCRN